MMTIDLEKELIKTNKTLMTPEELLIVKEYEQNAGILNDDSLLRVGLNKNLLGGQRIKGRISKLQEETKAFKQELVFHISQIEEICNKYYLRFLPSNLYNGTVDKELPFKINSFEAAYGVRCQCDENYGYEFEFAGIRMPLFFFDKRRGTLEIQQGTETKEEKPNPRKQNTFIVAPHSSFKLEERPKDPLFFYKINDEYYYLIHKWGNDLNIFRRAMPLLTSKLFTFLATLLPSLALLLFGGINIAPGNMIYISPLLAGMGGIALSIVNATNGLSFLPKNNWTSKYID
jgi:hypothetical protein